MTSVAVMQPYIFPYFGYYKLISKANVFIIYDNVQYINRGYINRNRILINGEAKYFNFQIDKADQFKNINEVKLKAYKTLRDKLLRQIFLSYKKAPYFEEVYSFIESILKFDFQYISNLNTKTLVELSSKLGLGTKFVLSSELDLADFVDLSKEGKLDSIIQLYDAHEIVMPPNSLELYENWSPANQCRKSTLKLVDLKYKQFSNTFVPNLSIIDVLMFNGFKQTSKLLSNS